MNGDHKVILVMGGGTALVGDPSGKDTEREFVDVEVVAERCKKMEANVRKITVSDNITFVNNYDWLSKLTMVEFMRDVGKHFTVNAMMKKDSVSARLEGEQGISFTEFSYALLQSYDYFHLHKTLNCDLQIGGSDQWGNIISGVDYIRRVTGDTTYALTMPLVTDKATGKKFGKSEGNAIWLDAEKTSPYQFYQFWINTSDESVIDYLKLFTFLSLEEIGEIEREFSQNPGERGAQKRLANEVTAFVHGAEAMESVQKVSNILFGEGALSDLSGDEKDMLVANAPTKKVSEDQLVVDVLVESGLASSKREARTFIESGAVVLGETKIDSIEASIASGVFENGIAILRRGKKQMSVLTM